MKGLSGAAVWGKVLLFGRDGLLGGELQGRLGPPGSLIAVGRGECDLSRPAEIRRLLQEVRPGLIVSAAAYSAVDAAESEPELAAAVNAEAPAVMAEEARKLGAFIVHYSTDYVFDGSGDAPYTEEDRPCPVNHYGRTKLAGEEAVLSSGASCLVLRTSWLYGRRGRNFISRLPLLAREGGEIKAVRDEVSVPNWAGFVASVTVGLLALGRDGLGDRTGLYHLTARGQASRYDFARRLLEYFPEFRERVKLVPISAYEYPAAARRPRFSALSPAKLERTFGLTMPDWAELLKEAAPDLAAVDEDS